MALIANPLYVPAELFVAHPEIVARPSGLFDQIISRTRSRRSHGSSSDETPVPSQDGFVEYDLRAGGPTVCEAPCKTLRMVPEDHPHYAQLRDAASFELLTRLGDMCRAEGITPLDMFFGERHPILDASQRPSLTLMVLADRRSSSQSSWIRTARKLHHYLNNKGISGIPVEILDPRFERNPHIHPCHRNDPIFPVWTQIAEEVLETVGLRGIFTLGCFRIGNDDRATHCPTTILMGVDRISTRDWKAVREAIVHILDSNGLGSVAVIVRQDTSPFRSGEVDSIIAREEDCQRAPSMGAPLSPSLQKYGNGTLGAWVEVQLPGTHTYIPFAITCSHCCFPPEEALPAAGVTVVRKWKAEGVRINDAQAKDKLTVNVPNPTAIRSGIARVNEEITKIEKNKKYKMVQQLKAQDEFIMPQDETTWAGHRKRLGELEEERKLLADFVKNKLYVFGSVFAASGLREVISTTDSSTMSIRNWALVQPKGHRAVGINGVTAPPRTLSFSQLRDFTESLPDHGDDLFKVGRATGFTKGKYHGLRSCTVAKRFVNGLEQEFKTWEHVVSAPGDIFLFPGDSGSLVFNMDGEVVGMLFGGTWCGGVAYFTSTKDLLHDIRKLTGLKDIHIVGGNYSREH
ncbi:hypothetical protein BJY01DRAFT_244698 [Aspergillus pseudoustus]|uniref:Trypsin-like cysteine/serine peptidase domain-containing protein n=1 Tax=Aspergillus pseudoustus TaxID=1810923 RepID=A0ABR4KII5_9EURO